MGAQELVEKGSPKGGLLLQTGWGAPLTPPHEGIFSRTQSMIAKRANKRQARVFHARTHLAQG